MLEVRCHTDRFGIISKSIDGSAWFDRASTEDIIDLLDGGWQGSTGHSFAAYDFLEFYKGDALSGINAHLEANSDQDIVMLIDLDSDNAIAWFEANRPDVFDELTAKQRNALSYA